MRVARGETIEASRGSDAEGLDECDLVMQGGLTSGVAYPAAVGQLRSRYRVCSVGGASVGAMAAALTAAAERGRELGGYDHLADVDEELTSPGFLPGLFQPGRPGRFAFELLLAAQRPGGRLRRWLGVAGRLLVRNLAPVTLTALAALVGTAWLIVAFGGGGDAPPGAWLALLVPLLLGAGVGLLGGVVHATLRLVTGFLPSNGYGLCSGMPQAGPDRPALVPWLHEQLQRCAGKPLDEPLTFDDLAQAGVTLQMTATDITAGRALRLPLTSDEHYLFNVDELAPLLPRPVLAHLVAHSSVVLEASDHPPGADGGHPELRSLPAGELPVLLASRVSMSFPLLLSAVPLWTVVEGRPMRHWLADGGITSNFPVHFFDAWLPRRPTFALNFVPGQAHGAGDDAAGGPRLRQRVPVVDVRGFLTRVFDTMQNWRDTMQAELPGYRDRIEDVALDAGEGGLNLAMDSAAITRLLNKGSAAGAALGARDPAWWDRHRFVRYYWLHQLLEEGLHGRAAPDQPGARTPASPASGCAGDHGVRGAFRSGFDEALAAGRGDPFDPPHDPRWYPRAARTTDRLLDHVDGWGEPVTLRRRVRDAWEALTGPATPVSFRGAHQPEPPLSMRMTPDV